jgi:hypothetical protein
MMIIAHRVLERAAIPCRYLSSDPPAQKWLKDRVGRTLFFEDIAHYQHIIVALLETDRLMGEVDGV